MTGIRGSSLSFRALVRYPQSIREHARDAAREDPALHISALMSLDKARIRYADCADLRKMKSKGDKFLTDCQFFSRRTYFIMW